MSFEKVQEIPAPEDIIAMEPMSEELKAIKEQKVKELKDILSGKSSKFIVIIGPCSADSPEPVCEYISKLAKVNEQVKDSLFIIPRIYTGKPRTTGEGYKGMLHQPNPEQAPNMLEGLLSIRKLFLEAMKESKFPIADEMLYPTNLPYVEDLLSYIAVGARSVENQQHRLTASGIDVPVGMKNPTSGDLTVMFNSIQAAQAAQTFIYNKCEVNTKGNPYTHVIMRGSTNKHGENIPNYHYEDIMRAIGIYEKKGFKNPAIIIDANHSNSNKCFYEQPRIVKEVLHNRKYSETIREYVKGFMIESYLIEGSQKIGENKIFGKSITDPCLGWEDTEALLYYMADRV